MFKKAQFVIPLQKIGFWLAAFLLLFTLSFQLFVTHPANAAQLTSRKIVMAKSTPATSTSYTFYFTPGGSATQEMIIDFCNNSPLANPADTCAFSSGTVPSVSSPTSSAASAGANGTAATVGTGTPVHTIKITGLTIAASTAYNITVSGITNPNANAPFYARIYTYTTGGAASYVPGNSSPATVTVGSPVDYGGVAMEAADNVTINSKVFETLSFCVYAGSCGTAASNLVLGDATTQALSSSQAYVNSGASYTLATNASSGVGVTMQGTTLCRTVGVSCNNGNGNYGVSTIAAIGSTAVAKSTGTEQFGMCVNKSTGGVTVAATYSDTVNNCNPTTGTYAGTSLFGFNDANTNGASGDTIMSSTTPVSTFNGNFVFLGDIAATTEAGLYTTTLNMVATGTF